MNRIGHSTRAAVKIAARIVGWTLLASWGLGVIGMAANSHTPGGWMQASSQQVAATLNAGPGQCVKGNECGMTPAAPVSTFMRFYGAPGGANFGVLFDQLGFGVEFEGPDGAGFFACNGQC